MAVIDIYNANGAEVLQALQDTVGSTTSRNNSRSTQNDIFQQRQLQNIQNMNNNNNIFGGNSGVGGGRRGGTGIGGF
jgi:hypothetical protein